MHICTCGKEINKKYLKKHLLSKFHLENGGDKEVIQEENIQEEERAKSYAIEDIQEEIINNDNIMDEHEYLSDFNNTYNFDKLENIVKNDKKPIKNVVFNDIITKRNKKCDDDEMSLKSDDLFSNKNKTPLLGKTKRELTARIRSYKLLFKEELKSFRVKKNPTEEELQKYLEEIDSILSTSKLDAFISDCIYYVLQILEATSQRFPNYNLKGITDSLRNNVQFNELMKILSIKYGVFSNTPLEIQMSIIVVSTAYLTIMNNRKEREVLEENLKNNKI